MTADNLSFQAGAATAAPAGGVPANQPPVLPDAVVLEVDGRKYTQSDVVTKIKHADQHIARLEAEALANREALAKADEIVRRAIAAVEVKTVATTGQPDPAATPAAPAPAAPAVAVGDVLAALDARDAERAKEQNWGNVTKTLTALHGANTDKRVDEVAAENGLTKAEAVELAKTKPALFLKLFPEVGKAGPRGPATFISQANPHLSSGPAARKPSGYAAARTLVQRMEAYDRRLAELTATN